MTASARGLGVESLVYTTPSKTPAPTESRVELTAGFRCVLLHGLPLPVERIVGRTGELLGAGEAALEVGAQDGRSQLLGSALRSAKKSALWEHRACG